MISLLFLIQILSPIHRDFSHCGLDSGSDGIEIHFKSGFHNDVITLHLDKKKKLLLNTDERIGYADSLKISLRDHLILDFYLFKYLVPIDRNKGRYIGLRLTRNGKIVLEQSLAPFCYM